jgi:hypothetical protein
MDKQYTERKQGLGMKWVKGETGKLYVCPIDVLSKLDNPTEEDLEKYCMDESLNPQNV